MKYMKQHSGLSALLIASAGASLSQAAQQSPNIIFILADDLGYGDLSCQGQTHFLTPNIDALAARGMRFTQHYSGCSVCAPARCSLLTGLHTGHTPIRGNAEVQPEGQQPMPAETFTASKLFKQAGYTTGVFGKWGLGAPGSASEPLNSGFDRFYGYNCQRQAHHYYPYFLWNDEQREILWNNTGLECGDYAPDLIHAKTVEFIRANKDRPFFCYYALVQPHAEMAATKDYMAKYRGKFLPESSYSGCDGGPQFRRGDYTSQPEAHAAFAAMVNMLDDYVGDVMAELEKLGIADNTLVLFASDNGPHEEGGADPVYFDSNGPFRGFKRDLYEGGVRVPFIASWPGKVPAGTVSDHVSAFWDFLPTMSELIGQPLPGTVDGISLLPTLLGQSGQKEHDYLYWEFHEQGGRQAIRKGNWKGVRCNVDKKPDSPLELYDLTKDPGETTNVSSQHPEVAAELDRLIRSARTESPVPHFNFPAQN
jgi:arylsulfatase A-like enzyme